MNTRIGFILLAAAALGAVSALAGIRLPGAGRAADTPERTIAVTGTGTVDVVPDRASFTFTAETRASTAKAALAADSDLAAAVARALEGAGVVPADLQTSQIFLSPQTKPNGTGIVGFVASTSLSVTAPIARSGAIVDAAVGAGATAVSGPSLSRADADAQYRAALAAAMEDAESHALALAHAAGLTLGVARTIEEGSGVVPVPVAERASDLQVEPGTEKITATVAVTYSAD